MSCRIHAFTNSRSYGLTRFPLHRWLAIDHGTKRIGLAVGDAPAGVASPLAVIDAQPLAAAIKRILRFAADYEACGIVVGWPINDDGSEGDQGKLARGMALELERTAGMDVRLWDERLSSFEADKALAGTMTRLQKRRRQDAVAAAAILRDFLAANGPSAAKRPSEIKAK